MSRRRRSTSDTTPFDTLRLEGSLFVPELLERAARGEAAAQKEADYGVPKGLKLHDEYGRAYRIATALWQDFAPQFPRTDLDPARLTRAFVLDLLRQCLGYTDIALLQEPVQIGDRGFCVTAQALGGRLPVIIATHSLGLDDPDPGFAIHGSGSKKKSAHQLAQELLNADRNSLWAIVTNGRTLRLLRDADTLTRPNFLEFDLETILREGEDRYADFSALWRMLHASRAGTATAPATDCIWEKWKSEGHAQGLRVRDGLRSGVTQALLILGTGFLTHRDNDALRQRLHDGTLTTDAYFQQLLRLIYRYLFLFCAEERDLLHPPLPEDEKEAAIARAARQSYSTGYALRRLRNRALRHTAHDSHGDLWLSLRITFRALSAGQPRLALPSLGGLFAETQCPDLDSAALANRDLLAAMRQLRWSTASGSLTAIDYRNMGPEELGSVYESLLELVPQLDLPARSFGFAGITDSASTSGNARKTTGSYYTPDSLVQELIKSALDPVIADRLAAQPDRPIDALLSITVCDPACGSGHFLLAAARRLAEKLAELRAPDGAVRPDDYRHALREVASRCLYGVDINPMAVELCRVALWLETVDPGKPLGFLNHHIRTGNSLLGTTPDLIAAGLPDDTFTAIEGDDKPACAELKKRNKKEREGFGPLFEKEEQTIRDRLRHAATQIEAMDDSQPAALQQKEAAFTTSETAPEYRHAKLLADLWCAAFVIKKHYPGSSAPTPPPDYPAQSGPSGQFGPPDLPDPTPADLFGQSTPASVPKAAKKPKLETSNLKVGTPWGITTAHLRDFVQGKPLPADLQTEAEALARQYRFFHWHLAFPQVFDQGGFACILGNPPWDVYQPEEEKFFAIVEPSVLNGKTANERKRQIASLKDERPSIWQQWQEHSDNILRSRLFMVSSGRLRLTSYGKTNLYSSFAELGINLVGPKGRAGMVVPTGIATDEPNKYIMQSLFSQRRLISLFDFENKQIFPEVHSSYKFALLTVGGAQCQVSESSFAFFLHATEELNTPAKVFSLSSDDVALMNPNTGTCPIFREGRDAELTKRAYRRVPAFHRESGVDGNPWGLTLARLFMMDSDSKAFVSLNEADGLHNLRRLYESKLMHQFDHRFATFSGVNEEQSKKGIANETSERGPDSLIDCRFLVPDDLVEDRYRRAEWKHGWALSLRDIARSTDERTAITCIIPREAAANNLPLILCCVDAAHTACLCADLNSFALDYIARQKVGGTHINLYLLQQFPVLPPTTYAQPCPWANDPKSEIPNPPSLRDWLQPRVLELTYTAWDLEAFAADCGWSGPPFRWDEERRFLLRCELDAAFFHLYLGPQTEWQQQPEALTRAFPTPRHAVSYIMDTFPIVKRKDEAKHGHYRTKETILQIYDALGEAMQSGTPYQTILTPPPADSSCCHPPRGH